MSIKKDAGDLLRYVYGQYIANNRKIWPDVVKKRFNKWDAGRINRALVYLNDLNLIKIVFLLGKNNGVYNFFITGLTPRGIEMAENKGKFTREWQNYSYRKIGGTG